MCKIWKFVEYEIFLEVEETTVEFLVCFDLSGEELGAGGVSVRAEEESGEEEGEEDRFANFKTRRGLCANFLKSVRICFFFRQKIQRI